MGNTKQLQKLKNLNVKAEKCLTRDEAKKIMQYNSIRKNNFDNPLGPLLIKKTFKDNPIHPLYCSDNSILKAIKTI